MAENRTLYFLENSRAFRVAWTLEELELPYTLKHYNRIEGKRAEPSMKADSGNPLGKSPYLVDSDVKLGESAAIVRYLVERYGSQSGKSDLLGAPDNWQERGDIESWISFSEGMMVHTLATIYPRWFTDESTARDIEDKMTGNIQNNLNLLEGALKNENYLVGGRLTAADIMCAFSAEYTFWMDTGITNDRKDKDNWPNTVAWLKRLANLPSYQGVLEKGGTHEFSICD
ncbi:related to GTT1 - glutathione S-transferase [Melanopsichium pennsylvanicum]|uniref:Related to GTT1 - glutathione S-transferase n=2 Tax=Melanopsichium pennsylvanicum TaxID=63383 RepID=A0AAJ4XSM1_9BASI|nr:related to GTT1-glutathione S-transferase [Melanopsichium pennsylvanicum 4]SNX87191.1 related to GTT1 - glutathione S-transferase [Melanopsichium pennsylvanicum]